MNKFKYLQCVGTTIVFSPVIALSTTAFVYEIAQNESEDTITTEVVEVKDETKKDSVVKEVVVQLKPTPPTPKPVVKDTLPKPVVETKDSVVVKLEDVKVKLDTTLKIN